MDLDFNAGYVCGVLCSDGSVEWREEFGNYWIALETVDDEFADKFFSALTTLTKGKLKFYRTQRVYKGKKYTTNRVVLRGKTHVKLFIDKWMIKTGSRTWRVPPIAFDNQSFRKGFLRGFFDGSGSVRLRLRIHKDGHKQKCRVIRVTSVNLRGLKQIKRLLKLEGIDCIIYPVKNHFSLDIDGKNRVANFIKNINFGISRKKKKAELSLDPMRFEEAIKL